MNLAEALRRVAEEVNKYRRQGDDSTEAHFALEVVADALEKIADEAEKEPA